MNKKKDRKLISLPIILAAVFVVGLLAIEHHKGIEDAARGEDKPPEVDFTWKPVGRVSLKDMVGTVKLKDDHALDFSTYKIRIVELGREIELPIEGVIGREYKQDISLAMFAGNLELLKRGEMTIQVEVADDAGQMTQIERVVKLKMPEGLTREAVRSIDFKTE